MLFWNKLIEYKEIPEKIPEFPEIWHKSPEIPELSKWLGIAISSYGRTEYIDIVCRCADAREKLLRERDWSKSCRWVDHAHWGNSRNVSISLKPDVGKTFEEH